MNDRDRLLTAELAELLLATAPRRLLEREELEDVVQREERLVEELEARNIALADGKADVSRDASSGEHFRRVVERLSRLHRISAKLRPLHKPRGTKEDYAREM
jgi:hypothetical protein